MDAPPLDKALEAFKHGDREFLAGVREAARSGDSPVKVKTWELTYDPRTQMLEANWIVLVTRPSGYISATIGRLDNGYEEFCDHIDHRRSSMSVQTQDDNWGWLGIRYRPTQKETITAEIYGVVRGPKGKEEWFSLEASTEIG